MRCAAMVMLVLVCGCAEERVVKVKGLMEGIPGAEGGWSKDLAREEGASAPARGMWEPLLGEFEKGKAVEGAEGEEGAKAAGDGVETRAIAAGLRKVNKDGSVLLVSKSPSDVMYHVMSTLRNKEHSLLFDQVLSEMTKAEYLRRGMEPRDAVKWLAKHEGDIADLFSTLPMGEQTPGVYMESIGRNMFRLEAPVAMRGEVRLTRFDVVIEKGEFRLLMIR